MKKLICLFIITLNIFINNLSAQVEDAKFVSNQIFKVNFLLPGLSYEKGIGKSSTLYLSPYLNGIITDQNDYVDKQSRLLITPCFNVAYRNYYNIRHRAQIGKPTSLNNADYITPVYILRYTKTAPDSEYEFLHQFGLAYGIQRNWRSGWGIDLNGGMKYTFNGDHINYYSPLEFFVQVSIGFWLGRKVDK